MSLIEVMVSMGILAVVTGAMMTAIVSMMINQKMFDYAASRTAAGFPVR